MKYVSKITIEKPIMPSKFHVHSNTCSIANAIDLQQWRRRYMIHVCLVFTGIEYKVVHISPCTFTAILVKLDIVNVNIR